MVYLFNKHIPLRKTIKNALKTIYGIGVKRAIEITNNVCINPNNRFYELKFTQISKIAKRIAMFYNVGSSLRRTIDENIKYYIYIRSYKGYRHKNGLPVRGQRTHTNAQTQKKIFKYL